MLSAIESNVTEMSGIEKVSQTSCAETLSNELRSAKEKTLAGPPFRSDLLALGSGCVEPKPQEPVSLLPTTYRNKSHIIRLVSADVHSFLQCELDLNRLNCIHHWLWIVGLPTSPRALHYQVMKRRNIIVTEQLDLHLVWSPARIYVKPLPRYLLNAPFWKSSICPHPELHRIALGFLLSYVALIEREVDYHLAVHHHLIPKEVTWQGWLALAEEIVLISAQGRSHTSELSLMAPTSALEPHMPVNPRFYYGELRLGRLNWIYRLTLGKPRGYLSGCTTYGAFMRDNVNSLITLFAYTTIVLSAMQVGLGTDYLKDNYAFGMASMVFSVFSILAPLSAIAAIMSVLGILFIVNLLRTLKIRRTRKNQGAGV